MIKYWTLDVTFKEVPDLVSLTFAISGCVHKCAGCHSTHLRQDIGSDLTISEYERFILKYKDHIDVVCFLGGDHDPHLLTLLQHSKQYYPDIKLCLYTGKEYHAVDPKLFESLDFIKIGSYNRNKGSLD